MNIPASLPALEDFVMVQFNPESILDSAHHEKPADDGPFGATGMQNVSKSLECTLATSIWIFQPVVVNYSKELKVWHRVT